MAFSISNAELIRLIMSMTGGAETLKHQLLLGDPEQLLEELRGVPTLEIPMGRRNWSMQSNSSDLSCSSEVLIGL